MTDLSEFQFNLAELSKPRPVGVSAYMRIKNEEQLIRLAIESPGLKACPKPCMSSESMASPAPPKTRALLSYIACDVGEVAGAVGVEISKIAPT